MNYANKIVEIFIFHRQNNLGDFDSTHRYPFHSELHTKFFVSHILFSIKMMTFATQMSTHPVSSITRCKDTYLQKVLETLL